MANIKIYGAGMAGLLAAIVLSKKHIVKIFEKKESLEQNHFALLRFKNNDIEQITNIKCKKVNIKKAIWYNNKIYSSSNVKFDNDEMCYLYDTLCEFIAAWEDERTIEVSPEFINEIGKIRDQIREYYKKKVFKAAKRTQSTVEYTGQGFTTTEPQELQF